MSASLVIALQAAATAVPSGADAPLPIEFDLARAAREEAVRCGTSSGATIVVCGRLAPRNAFPLDEMARRYERGPLRAEVGIGAGASARAYVEQVDFGQGRVSNRVMFGIRTRF